MAVSNIKALIPGELQKVWDLVLNTENYAAWRSDLSKTEAISDKQFIEYTKNGYPTTFTVTLVKPYRRSLEYGAQYLLRPETGSDFASRRIPVGICYSVLQRNLQYEGS